MQFNINTDAAVVLTNELEKLHRSRLPNAIRGTLNSVAFDVKKHTLHKITKHDKKKHRPGYCKGPQN